MCGFHITLVGTHVPKYVIDRGLEDWTAAAILSLIGLFNIFGSLLSGYLSAKMSKKIILSGIYFLRGISIILFIFTPASNVSAFLFGASFGFLWLSTIPLVAGTVDNHKNPKLAPNINEAILLGGVKMKKRSQPTSSSLEVANMAFRSHK